MAPLTFHMSWLGKQDMKFRMVPNVAYDAYIPRYDGICGQWVRPEDVHVYEQYVNTFEFITDSLEKERTLLKIYKNELKRIQKRLISFA